MTIWHSRPHVTQVHAYETERWPYYETRPIGKPIVTNTGIRVYFGVIAAIAVLCLVWLAVRGIW